MTGHISEAMPHLSSLSLIKRINGRCHLHITAAKNCWMRSRQKAVLIVVDIYDQNLIKFDLL